MDNRHGQSLYGKLGYYCHAGTDMVITWIGVSYTKIGKEKKAGKGGVGGYGNIGGGIRDMP